IRGAWSDPLRGEGARPFRSRACADERDDAGVELPCPCRSFPFCLGPSLLTSLSRLATDASADLANTLALVWVATEQLPDVRTGRADQLLVDSVSGVLRLSVDAEGDPLRRFDGDRVAVAEGELEVRSLGQDTVTGSDDLEGLRVAFGHTDDHIVDERAGQSVQRTRFALLVRTAHCDDTVFERYGDRLGDGDGQLALRSLDGDILAVDLDL